MTLVLVLLLILVVAGVLLGKVDPWRAAVVVFVIVVLWALLTGGLNRG